MAEETSELLTRLSQKPGVQSTLILSRQTGAIVRTTGLVAEPMVQNPDDTLNSSSSDLSETFGSDTKKLWLRNAQDVARMVWSFMEAAGTLVEDMDADDEVKLLRLRTKRNELVIVPDPKFILVVIHDTPPA